MLRHIISVSLAMIACASLMPTKANAINFTLTSLGSLQRNPGDRISFILGLDPQNDGGSNGVKILEVYRPSVFDPTYGIYDYNELSFVEVLPIIDFSKPVTFSRDIAAIIFDVINPIKDGKSDVSVRVDYQASSGNGSPVISNSTLDVEPVPEPVTIFGTATVLGCGVLFKRKSSKKTVS